MTDPEVSFIIVTYNRRDDLVVCLDSIFQQDYPHKQILVIDNNSSDGTRDVVRQRYPEVTLYTTPHNMGTSITRNAGIRLSHGEFVWFLDSDSRIVDPSLTRVLVERMIEHPDLGAVGGEAVMDEEEKIVGVKRLVLEPNGMIRGEFLLDLANFEVSEADVLSTCNLFTRRPVLRQVGGFDPLFFFYLEDIDLTYRIRNLGYRLAVLGKMPVVHSFSEEVRGRHVFQPRRNRNFFVFKNFGLREILLLPLRDIQFLLSRRTMRRVLVFARKAELGAKGFVRVVPAREAAARLTTAKVAAAVWKAGLVALSLFASYLLFLPHLPQIMASRGRRTNHLDQVDLTMFRREHSAPPRATEATDA